MNRTILLVEDDPNDVFFMKRAMKLAGMTNPVHVISNGTATKVVANVEGPADIGIDTKRNVIALPRFMAGRVEYFTISR